MDLRSIINTEAGENSSKQAAPVTPVQAAPQHGFREYGHPSHASPGKQPSQDYGSQPTGPYASPTTYQPNYPARPPQPPPIQAPPHNDLRSPARSYSAQSPYQRTPSSSMSNTQYPFPSSNPTPQSPAQLQQYPPTFQQRERESYPHSNPPPHLQHQGSNSQASPTPHTPPIGMPGAPHPYLQHQRSHSSVSTSTPTSAQSQPPYYNQYPQDSPVSTNTFPPNHLPQHARQPSIQSQHSQPGTPLGPPLNQRQVSGGYVQPTSPYQQRSASIGPFSQFRQTSPAPPPPATIPRMPSTPGAYDSQRTSLSEQHRRSQSERERSLSVSPKTRLPSQPPGHNPPQVQQNIYNPTKRKMEDRELPIEAPRRTDQQDVKPHINGDHRISPATTASPPQPPKKKIRYTEPPIWAQSIRNKKAGGIRGQAKVNGKQAAGVTHNKLETNGNQHPPPAAPRPASTMNSTDPHPSLLLGPWEQSITGIKPAQALTTQIADFIFMHVINRNDLGELASRGVEIEIEAKLGQLTNIETNDRLALPVTTECVVSEGYRLVGFRTAMTEHQHQVLNTFLNAKVAEAHPSNPNKPKPRVEIVYVHRRENDKFYELPPSMRGILPAAIQQLQHPKKSAKIRVTHDQKTNEILAKIVKVRIADLNIFMPRQPLDCRISINFEMRFDGDIEDIIAQSTADRQADRSKDRLSYTQGHYQIDLTQVTKKSSHNGVNLVEKEHELEVEVSTAAVRDQGMRAMNGEPNEYLALVEGMIDNIRVLARAVPAH